MPAFLRPGTIYQKVHAAIEPGTYVVWDVWVRASFPQQVRGHRTTILFRREVEASASILKTGFVSCFTNLYMNARTQSVGLHQSTSAPSAKARPAAFVSLDLAEFQSRLLVAKRKCESFHTFFGMRVICALSLPRTCSLNCAESVIDFWRIDD